MKKKKNNIYSISAGMRVFLAGVLSNIASMIRESESRQHQQPAYSNRIEEPSQKDAHRVHRGCCHTNKKRARTHKKKKRTRTHLTNKSHPPAYQMSFTTACCGPIPPKGWRACTLRPTRHTHTHTHNYYAKL